MMRHREGFTLVEMLMVAVLGMMAVGAALQVLFFQERSYRQMSAMTNTAQTNRLGLNVLINELRELSAEDGDLVLAEGSEVGIRALRKVGFVCNSDRTFKRLDVSQLGTEPFAQNDSIIVLVDRDSLKAADDIWETSIAFGIQPLSSCSGLLGGLIGTVFPDGSLTRIKLPDATTMKLDSVYAGALVRSFRHYRYGAYESGGSWVLGRVEGAEMTPLIGPILPPAEGGLVLTYYDEDGNVLPAPVAAGDRDDIARIRIEIKGASRTNARRDRTQFVDSLTTEIYVRG